MTIQSIAHIRRDISGEGVFLGLEHPPELGSIVDVELRPHPALRYQAMAVVVRVAEDDAAPGCAVRFIDLPEDDMRELDWLMRAAE